MMKKIEVDASLFTDPQAVHTVLKQALCEDGYIGNNLDALHDVLTAVGKKTKITVKNFTAAEKQLGDYASALALVLASSASSNRYLTVVFE